MNASAHTVTNAFEKSKTRWEELCERVQEIVEIATCVDSDGIDLYFLNSEPVKNVTNPEMVKNIFINSKRPNGYTPLSLCYERVLEEKNTGERPVLILVSTDGEPNKRDYDGRLTNDIAGFTRLIFNRKKPECSPTCIMACTNDKGEIGWLNKLDDAPNVDIVDDFASEKKEITEKQGIGFHYNKGDYAVNVLLGAIDPIYDKLDEKKLSSKEYAEYMGCKGRVASKPSGCCIIS
jgi:hypothetical protein